MRQSFLISILIIYAYFPRLITNQKNTKDQNMKSKLLLLVLPLFFFACEAEEEGATLVGTWTLTDYEEYEGTNCTGTPSWNMDSLAADFGNNFTWMFEFTAETVTNTMKLSLSDEDMCSMWGGTLSGDSCSVEWFGYTMNMPIDSMCFDFGGVLSDGICSVTETNIADYTTDGDAITITGNEGTDSAEVSLGTWSISGDVLTMSVAGDSSCTNLTLSK